MVFEMPSSNFLYLTIHETIRSRFAWTQLDFSIHRITLWIGQTFIRRVHVSYSNVMRLFLKNSVWFQQKILYRPVSFHADLIAKHHLAPLKKSKLQICCCDYGTCKYNNMPWQQQYVLKKILQIEIIITENTFMK